MSNFEIFYSLISIVSLTPSIYVVYAYRDFEMKITHKNRQNKIIVR